MASTHASRQALFTERLRLILGEAAEASALVERFTRALETGDFEKRLGALEATAPGRASLASGVQRLLFVGQMGTKLFISRNRS
jgi:hypothetical protein